MTKQDLNTMAGVFGRCFLICVGLQVFSLVMYLLLSGWAIDIHTALFTGLTEHDVWVAAYYFLMLLKVLGLTLFLTPWAALKLTAVNME